MGNPLPSLHYESGASSSQLERRLKIRTIFIGALVCLAAFLTGCHQAAKEPVTLTFLDPEWSHDHRERDASHEIVLTDFTKETGIRVTHLPAPENASAQLELTQNLLKKGAATPDVYGIDVIWPGMLSDYLIDLKPYFAAESQASDPALIANYTVKGKLVAMPYHSNIGVLFYRTDLLKKYGYREPPRTWDELEKMATRIQAGERAGGQKDFWGYIWPGVANEALFCDAIEWQASSGGGHIVEADGKVNVNNPERHSRVEARSTLGRHDLSARCSVVPGMGFVQRVLDVRSRRVSARMGIGLLHRQSRVGISVSHKSRPHKFAGRKKRTRRHAGRPRARGFANIEASR